MVVGRMRLIIGAAVLFSCVLFAQAASKGVHTASSIRDVRPRQHHAAPPSKPGFVSGKLAEDAAAVTAPAPAPAPVDTTYTGSVYSMYMGILVIFGIMWTIYFFLYAWQYDSMGNYSFFLSSFIVLIILISLGLSKYFTGSILTALLWTVIFLMISGSGFMAMDSITSPDRFQGDKSNMGRTKLE